MLTSATDCQEYIRTHSAKEIAEHLRRDQKLCNSGGLPSILALHLPTRSSSLVDAIAASLWENPLHKPDNAEGTKGKSIPGDDFRPLSIQRQRYQGLVESIKSYLSRFQPGKEPGAPDSDTPVSILQSTTPTTQEFETAIKVLQYLMRVPATNVTIRTPIEEAFIAIETHIALDPESRIASQSIPENWGKARKTKSKREHKPGRFGRCYMCHYNIITPHRYYPSLCTPCGSFNLQESSISHPEKLDMRNRTALVTGGRVNLGYSVALRLLRCGASVIVSSRYPLDAEARYRAEPDFGKWQDRICVVGADFRHMKDAGGLLVQVKNILNMWNKDGKKEALLDVLVNNAAQTLTDSTNKEKTAVEQEQKLLNAGTYGGLQFGDYKAKIRGGTRENRVLLGPGTGNENSYFDEGASSKIYELSNDDTNPPNPEYQLTPETSNPPGPPKEIAVVKQSSWTQSISQIPYQDIGDVLAINSFVPLMLIRELLPLMGTTRNKLNPTVVDEAEELSGKQGTPRVPKPAGYIINVSSREGISEVNPAATIKNGHHVHTNMSKAALNMITETEGYAAWRDRRVAINSVDPGFMSAADGSVCPIGWEDGAARVLWCVAKGEVEKESIWGRFLKHFGAAEAVVRGL